MENGISGDVSTIRKGLWENAAEAKEPCVIIFSSLLFLAWELLHFHPVWRAKLIYCT